MKNSRPVRSLSLAALIVGLGLIPADCVTAQDFAVLHSFTARSGPATNSDGSYPVGRLVANAAGNTLYGTANVGGSSGRGTLFAVNTDGSGFTTVHHFNIFTNGSQPLAGVILSGNRLYGTTWQGGTSGNGALFAVNTDGSGFTTLRSFTALSGPNSTNSDGAKPRSGLVLSGDGNTLYGTAELGGSSGNGTVFKINTNGTGFTTLHSFTAIPDHFYTNSDGIAPNAGVILSGNTLYGTAIGGGSFARGTVFKVNTDGTGFTTLHSFTRADYHPVLNPSSTNSDGANPFAGLVLSGNTLYGTTEEGGGFGNGTVFKVNTDGTGFTRLHSFHYLSDGDYADAGLVLSGNTLYGTAMGGGLHGGGTVFALNTNGTGFTTLHHFNDEDDGGYPDALVLVGNSLYGVAREDGSLNNGTVFRLSFAPQLKITPSGANVILTWPTNVAGFDYTGFTLQSTTNLLSPTVWITNSPAPIIVNGLNVVTNPASGAQKFFRLKSQ